MNVYISNPPVSTEEFLVEDIGNYRYLTNGHMPVPGVDDAAEFRLTIEAMNIMGIPPEDQSALLRVISSILMFGNMTFQQDRKSDQATLPDNTGRWSAH